MSWLPTVLSIIQLLYSECAPDLKVAAVSELKAIEAKEGSNPFIVMALRVAEDVVANLPEKLP